jgi:hypothetical protein
MTNNQEQVLSALVDTGRFGAKAEAIPDEALLHSTLVIPNHIHALAPETLLIIGGRGAGKSHLFRVLNMPEGAKTLLAEGRISYVNQESFWLVGYSAAQRDLFPDMDVLQELSRKSDRTALIGFWRGMLMGSILALKQDALTEILRHSLSAELIEALSGQLKRVSAWHPRLLNEIEAVAIALDEVDAWLTEQKRYLFVTYDDLDVMAVEWNEKRAMLQALLQFWLNQFRRWKHIRPKIFLRADLFSPEFLQFPDAAKLSGNKMELRWNASQLYQLVFKIWANQNGESLDYLNQAGLKFAPHAVWGQTFTTQPTEENLRLVVHQMIGQFMGAGPKKGRSFEWISNHLQDAKGDIFPRSMLNLFSLAATDELENKRAKPGKLLMPESLAFAIEKVSERRIGELQEEYPWLDSLRPVLQDKLVPVEDSTMAEWLESVEWREKPPVSGAKSQIELLLQLGIFRRTGDGRLHVPDIYLFGFGLKRKGGIPRPTQ